LQQHPLCAWSLFDEGITMAATSQPPRPLSAMALDLITKDIGDEWQRRKRSMDKWLLATLGVGAAFTMAITFLPAAAFSAAVVCGGAGLCTAAAAAGQTLSMRCLRLQRDEMLRDKAAKSMCVRIDGLNRLENGAFLATGISATGATLAWMSWFAVPATIPLLAPLAATLGACAVGAATIKGGAKLFARLAVKTDSIISNAITTTAAAPTGAATLPGPQTPDFNAAAAAPDWSPVVETERTISIHRPLQLKV
jgi:hypothetical protein